MKYRKRIKTVEAVQYQPGLAVGGFPWVEVDLEHHIQAAANDRKSCKGPHAEIAGPPGPQRACPGDYVVRFGSPEIGHFEVIRRHDFEMQYEPVSE
jgi:hypothetical protein